MSDRNYYVFCDDNCKFPAMTKEQILAAIAEATGNTPTDCDSAFITKIKEQHGNTALKFWVGTMAQYNAIETKEKNCFYIITDDTTDEDIAARIDGLQKSIDELCGKQTKLIATDINETNFSDYLAEYNKHTALILQFTITYTDTETETEKSAFVNMLLVQVGALMYRGSAVVVVNNEPRMLDFILPRKESGGWYGMSPEYTDITYSTFKLFGV